MNRRSFNNDGKYDCVSQQLFERLVQKKNVPLARWRDYKYCNGAHGWVKMREYRMHPRDTGYIIDGNYIDLG